MAFEQIEAFLNKMQSEPELKNEVLAASTADDVARIALKLGFEFSGDELLRMSGKKVGKINLLENKPHNSKKNKVVLKMKGQNIFEI